MNIIPRWTSMEQHVAQRAFALRWKAASAQMANVCLQEALKHRDATDDLVSYYWVLTPYRVDNPLHHDVGSCRISSKVGGTSPVQTPLGTAFMKWWVGWSEVDRIAVICCGP